MRRGGREPKRTPNPYAKPLGRKTPAQRRFHEPDLMTNSRQDRRQVAHEIGSRDIGEPLYDIEPGPLVTMRRRR